MFIKRAQDTLSAVLENPRPQAPLNFFFFFGFGDFHFKPLPVDLRAIQFTDNGIRVLRKHIHERVTFPQINRSDCRSGQARFTLDDTNDFFFGDSGLLADIHVQTCL
ncbi:MAG TPA: hypothetical protein VK633_13155, partial [Verrucomicrobiae bacterium]|nr:hypothetical protein [Verrucomicrobiae bacterium]